MVEAIASYLRESNANLGGLYPTSQRTDALVAEANDTAARFLGASAGEVAFGANMTTLNFALSRAASREWAAGDEIVCTRLDHDGNVAPWLELAHDNGLEVRFADVDDDCRLDLDQLRSLLSDRTRVVAFTWASNAVGTVTPVAEIAALAHEAGALAWVDAVHYAPHGPIDVAAVGRRRVDLLAVQVLRAAPRARVHPRRARRDVADVQGSPADHRFETGTLAARAARRLRRRGRLPR